ncbi:hypothetical protein KIW84_022215 [Lathyrus oleraceus]|uniref:Uncharacterized protein n=1 Tax=Pisum sativum TaxID=3888 RepID=A0A9D4YB57_PEA|nr:hypothetical protein KIW84_022215 [Pisum sativum]
MYRKQHKRNKPHTFAKTATETTYQDAAEAGSHGDVEASQAQDPVGARPGVPVESKIIQGVSTTTFSIIYNEVLLTSSDHTLSNLTPALVVEANMLRERYPHRYSRTLFGMCPRSRRGETSRRGRHWFWLWFRRGETSSRSGTSFSRRSQFSSKSHAHKLDVFSYKHQTTRLHFDNSRKCIFYSSEMHCSK